MKIKLSELKSVVQRVVAEETVKQNIAPGQNPSQRAYEAIFGQGQKRRKDHEEPDNLYVSKGKSNLSIFKDIEQTVRIFRDGGEWKGEAVTHDWDNPLATFGIEVGPFDSAEAVADELVREWPKAWRKNQFGL